MVYVATGCKELKRKYPVVTGTDADSKHEGRVVNLQTQGKHGLHSTVLPRNKAGIDEGSRKR